MFFAKLKDKIISKLSYLTFIILLELFFGVIFFFLSTFKYFFFLFEIFLPETFVVDTIYAFMHGTPLYENLCTFPYNLNPYGPVYYLICALLAKIMKINSYFPLLFLCRFIVLFSTLLCAILIFAIARRLKYTKTYSLIASLFFLGSPLIFGWGFLARVDMMAIAFSLAAIYVLLIARHPFFFYLSILFSLLAVYTKQPYLIAGISILFYLFLQKKYRDAIIFATLFLGLGLVIFIVISYLSPGSVYLHLVYSSLVVPYSFKIFLGSANICWWKILPNLLLTIIGIKILSKEALLLKIYSVLSIIMAFLGTYRAGSFEHYWLGALSISSLIVAAVIHRLSLSNNKTILKLLLVIFLFNYIRFPIAWFRGRFYIENEISLMVKKRLAKICQKSKGYIFYTGGSDLSILAGKPVLRIPWADFCYFVKKHKCSDDEIVSMINRKEFCCVAHYEGDIMKQPFLTENIRQALHKSYSLNQIVSGVFVYTPKANNYENSSN